MKFPDQLRVFITGAGSGLGRQLAVDLAKRHSARILLGDINQGTVDETAAMVRDQGGNAETIICDVTKPDDLKAAAGRMIELWDGTDLLVNNAGVSAAGTIGDFALEDWRWCMEINLWGVIHGCHYFAPAMRERGSGWILNVASNAAITSLPEMGPYNVSKAGVLSLSETLRSELGAHGVSVSVLCPTFFPSNLMDSFRSSHERQEKVARAMFRRASVTTADVSMAGIKGTEQGKFVIIPQTDGKLTWWLKRASPQRFYGLVTRKYGEKVVDRA